MDLPPEPPRVELHGAVEVGLKSELDRPPELGVDLARLMTRFGVEHAGGMLQVEAKEQELRLIDARMWAGDKEGLSLEAGRMKTPFSQDILRPAPKLLLPSRPMLVDLGPRRDLGAQARWQLGERALIRAGWFVEAGAMAAVDLHLPADLSVHLAGSLEGGDVGLAWDHGDTEMRLEGLGMRGKEGWDAGFAYEAGHTFHVGEFGVQPVLGLDSVWVDAAPRHCGTVALRGLHRGFVGSLSWETSLAGELEHLARVQVQASF